MLRSFLSVFLELDRYVVNFSEKDWVIILFLDEMVFERVLVVFDYFDYNDEEDKLINLENFY